MTEQNAVPEQMQKLAEALYVPTFIEVCRNRGYTHIRDEAMMKKAVDIVSDIRDEQNQQQKVRDVLAKQASEKYLEQR